MSTMQIIKQFSMPVQPAGDYCSMYTCKCDICGITKTAAITMFEYSNFRCPECARRVTRKGVRNPLKKTNKCEKYIPVSKNG